MDGLYCTTFGCTIHDYPVAPQYCTYQYEMEKRRETTDQIKDMLQLIVANMATSDTAASPQPVQAPRATQKPTQRRSGGGGVPL